MQTNGCLSPYLHSYIDYRRKRVPWFDKLDYCKTVDLIFRIGLEIWEYHRSCCCCQHQKYRKHENALYDETEVISNFYKSATSRVATLCQKIFARSSQPATIVSSKAWNHFTPFYCPREVVSPSVYKNGNFLITMNRFVCMKRYFWHPDKLQGYKLLNLSKRSHEPS